MTKMIKFIVGSLVIVSVLFVTGCNTVAGLGQDMQAGGKAITSAADKHK